jgi:transposase
VDPELAEPWRSELEDSWISTSKSIDGEAYKRRNRVERFFCLLKQFRRIATRYEKLASRYAAFVLVVAGFVWREC